ncbi:MAG: short-subunit dehydrogenase [Halieaceae bacterium]|jgi:short-subunit dehydrogenase
MDISGKFVVVTGASGGIGAALSRQLDKAGAKLLLVGRNEEKLQELLAELSGEGHRIVRADITTATGRDAVSGACGGELDVLINNAGLNGLALLESQAVGDIEALTQINLLAPILLCQRLLPELKLRDSGIILNIGSTFGSIGYPGFAVYSASKFGLRGFTEALRRELADTAIRVLYFAPRTTSTAMNSAKVDAMNAQLGNACDDPKEVAKAAVNMLRFGGSSRFLGWPEKLFVKLNGLFPTLVDNALRKQLPIIKTFAAR